MRRFRRGGHLRSVLRVAVDFSTTRRDAVTIVERLNRIGGRLNTDLIRVGDNDVVREEEGGMRFNTSMTELMQLIAALGLCDQVVPFPMSSSPYAASNTNRFRLRGHSFTGAEAVNGKQGEVGRDLSTGWQRKSEV